LLFFTFITLSPQKMAKKNKIDRKYYLLESETVKMENNSDNQTSFPTDDFAVFIFILEMLKFKSKFSIF
jgi:hypothetical protein